MKPAAHSPSSAGCGDAIIADDYVASDAHLEHLYDEWAAREADESARLRLRESFRSRHDHILKPLEYIVALGGIDSYLLSAGLDRAAIEALRTRMLV